MEKVLIMCRSLTQAQRAQRLLERSGLISSLVKAPAGLGSSGCAYALLLHRHGAEALRVLKARAFPYGKVYRMDGDKWEAADFDLP